MRSISIHVSAPLIQGILLGIYKMFPTTIYVITHKFYIFKYWCGHDGRSQLSLNASVPEATWRVSTVQSLVRVLRACMCACVAARAFTWRHEISVTLKIKNPKHQWRHDCQAVSLLRALRLVSPTGPSSFLGSSRFPRSGQETAFHRRCCSAVGCTGFL